MMKQVRYIKDIEIMKPDHEPELMAIKARGIAELKKLVVPFLMPRPNREVPDDGIYELDFIVDERGAGFTDVEMEVDIVFRLKNLPSWVKGIRIFGAENSDIELI
jgi:hypothetical protein